MKYEDTGQNGAGIDLIDTLEMLLAGARSGTLTGLAFGATFKGGKYLTDVTGSCAKHLTHTRGMVATLGDEIGLLLQQRRPHDTR